MWQRLEIVVVYGRLFCDLQKPGVSSPTPTLTLIAHLNDEAGGIFFWLWFWSEQKDSISWRRIGSICQGYSK